MNNKIKIFIILFFFFIVIYIIFYPNQKLIVKGITESTEMYSVMKSYNSTQTYYEDETYLDYECEMHDEFRDNVGIPYLGEYDFFYEAYRTGGVSCDITDIPSSNSVYIKIKSSNVRNMDLTYPIFIEYYAVRDCVNYSSKVFSFPPVVEYGEFLVNVGESYEGRLSYKQVFDLKPNISGERLTAFSFKVGTPKWCRQVRKVKQVEKTKSIKVTKNETLNNTILIEDNLTIKRSFFQKWTMGDNIASYGCPPPYYFVNINNSCYYKKLK